MGYTSRTDQPWWSDPSYDESGRPLDMREPDPDEARDRFLDEQEFTQRLESDAVEISR